MLGLHFILVCLVAPSIDPPLEGVYVESFCLVLLGGVELVVVWFRIGWLLRLLCVILFFINIGGIALGLHEQHKLETLKPNMINSEQTSPDHN